MVKNISKKFVGGNSSGSRGAFSKAFSVLPQAQDDEKLIEVFDVLIKTQNRLIIKEGDQDIHKSAAYIDLAESVLNTANLEHRMNLESSDK